MGGIKLLAWKARHRADVARSVVTRVSSHHLTENMEVPYKKKSKAGFVRLEVLAEYSSQIPMAVHNYFWLVKSFPMLW